MAELDGMLVEKRSLTPEERASLPESVRRFFDEP